MKTDLMKLLAFFILWPTILNAQNDEKIFKEDAPKLVFAGHIGQYTEGATMAPDGMVYFSDILMRHYEAAYTGLIWKYNPETGKTEVFRSPSGSSNGLAFDKKGNLIVCEADNQGGLRITSTDMQTGLTKVLTWEFEGKRYNAPNDLVIDKVGNIYFTDPKVAGRTPMNQPVHGVYKIDTSGVVSLVIANIRKPNGITISPDQSTLYISTADNIFNGDVSNSYQGERSDFTGKLLAYTIEEEGNLTFKKELADFGNGIGDGMTMDTEGNIYVSLFFNAKIAVYSPEGKLIDELQFPNWVTNARFGRDKYKNTLFVTGIEGLYEVQTNKEGFHIPFEETPPKPTFEAIAMSSDEMGKYVGMYMVNERFGIKIFREGEQLFSQGTNRSKIEIFPYQEDKFFAKIINVQMVFNKDSNGNITDMDVMQHGSSNKFIRQEKDQVE